MLFPVKKKLRMMDSQKKIGGNPSIFLGDDKKIHKNTVELSYIAGHHVKWFSPTCRTYERECCLDFKRAW